MLSILFDSKIKSMSKILTILQPGNFYQVELTIVIGFMFDLSEMTNFFQNYGRIPLSFIMRDKSSSLAHSSRRLV